jgi:hypothetical protein
MNGGMAIFQSELRSAVREAREAPATEAAAKPAPNNGPQVSVSQAGPRRAAARPRQATGVRRTVVRLWLPLTPLWIILAPFALLLAPILAFVPATRGVPPFRAVFAVGAALIALSGTVIDVDTPDARVCIRIY